MAARDIDRIARRDRIAFFSNRHTPATRKDVINLFKLAVMMRGDGAPRRAGGANESGPA